MSQEYARKLLGVRIDASQDDLRAAWKTCARRFHPDQRGGSASKFIAVNEAYEALLNPAASSPPKAQQKPKERRGGQSAGTNGARSVFVAGSLRQKCEALLKRAAQSQAFSTATSQNAGFYVDPRHIQQGAEIISHVAKSVVVESGCVTITVDGQLGTGLNSVSMPSGTRAGDAPSLVKFRAKRSGAGRIRLSETAKSSAFPWAKEVELVFAA